MDSWEIAVLSVLLEVVRRVEEDLQAGAGCQAALFQRGIVSGERR